MDATGETIAGDERRLVGGGGGGGEDTILIDDAVDDDGVSEISPPSSPRRRLPTRRHMYGIGFLLSVVTIWVASSYAIQFILVGGSESSGGTKWDKPFALTWFNTGCFSVYFLGFLIKKEWRQLLMADPLFAPKKNTATTAKRKSRNYSEEHDDDDRLSSSAEEQDSRPQPSPTDSLVMPSQGQHGPGGSRRTSGSGSSSSSANESLIHPGGDDPPTTGKKKKELLPMRHVIKLAAMFCPFWFLANYLFNVSLAMTSVASSMIISTTSSAFTLTLAVVVKMDTINIGKVFAVALCMGGVALVVLSDNQDSSQNETVFGDALALGGAFFYACYTLLLRKKIEDEEVISMPMFFAFLGFINLVCLAPLLPILSVTGIEPFELPPMGTTLAALVANALIGTVLSDYLWLWGMLLSTPLVATLALTLSIPASIIVDALIASKSFSVGYLGGAMAVVCGFVISNVDGIVSSAVLRCSKHVFASCVLIVKRMRR